MARSHISAIFLILILILILTLGASRSASQGDGFRSINCGGDAYNDSKTGLIWEADPFNKNNNAPLYGNISKVKSGFTNTTNPMTSLRYFPNLVRNTKFCYSLNVSNGTTYLLRASFLYGNYDGMQQPPNFVLMVNYDHWTNVTTTNSTTPVMHELTFVSMQQDLNICLAPQSPPNHTPFISTLELRPLKRTMYATPTVGDLFPTAFSQRNGLMLWKRINYGARTNEAIRYPDDIYDRIWEADTTEPIASTSPSNMGTFYGQDPAEPPAAVMATAITTNDSKGNLSFTYEGFGGDAGYRIEMHFAEPLQNPARTFQFAFPNSKVKLTNLTQQILQGVPIIPASSPISVFLDQLVEFPIPFQITFFPVDDSPLGPLLNAIELFRWTTAPLSPIGTFQDDVHALGLIQAHFNLTGYGQGDPCTPKEYRWTWIKCNDENSPRITEINLANLDLKGDIPPSILNLPNLKHIDLSNNNLSGVIPNFTPLQQLQYLNISYNNLCGSSPFLQNPIDYMFIADHGLCNESKCNCASSSSSSDSTSVAKGNNNYTRKYNIAISLLGALYIVSMLILLAYIYKERRNRTKVQNPTSTITNQKGVDDLQGLPFIIKMFTYNDISNATLNFTTILGEGGFGKVYQGLLPSGDAIAVKMLAEVSKQGLKQFYNEVAILSRVRHKNLVSLIGYCVENTYMLIYEYIPKGNLRDLIYGDVESPDKPLPWKTRLHIALDAAQGLEYLHTGCDPTIIHRDVKSSNILLSDKMQAKVSDFGLSRLKEGDTAISHVSTINVVGTIGYLDPGYNLTNQLTDKSDVYSFGIVLLELICGRAPIDMFNSPPHIVEWATPAIVQGKIVDIVDPMLANGYKPESMWMVVDAAFGCVESDRNKRPKMRQVCQILQNALEMEMDENSAPHSLDVSGSSSTLDEKLPTLHYIDSLRIKLEPQLEPR